MEVRIDDLAPLPNDEGVVGQQGKGEWAGSYHSQGPLRRRVRRSERGMFVEGWWDPWTVGREGLYLGWMCDEGCTRCVVRHFVRTDVGTDWRVESEVLVEKAL